MTYLEQTLAQYLLLRLWNPLLCRTQITFLWMCWALPIRPKISVYISLNFNTVVNGTAFQEFLANKTTVPKFSEISVPSDFLTGVSGIFG